MSPRFLGAAALVGVGALVLCTLTSTTTAHADGPPVEAAQAWQYDPHEVLAPEDIATRAADEQVTETVAEHRLRLDRAAAVVQQQAQERWPGTFAGAWISRPDFKVHVAFTQDERASRDALAANFPSPADLVAERADRTLAQLSSLQERVNADRRAQRSGGPSAVPSLSEVRGNYDTEVDVAAGKVVLHVPSSVQGRAKKEVATAYGSATEVVPGVAAPSGCTVADCRYAMMGGLELQVGSSALCSSAFTGSYGSSRVVLSAAHCYVNTGETTISNAWSQYGRTQAYAYGGSVDAQRILRTGGWRESSKFFVAGQDPRLVTSYTAASSIVVGAYIAKSGCTTGTTYGYVKSKTVSPGYVPNGANFISNDFCVAPGDSGGAVWGNSSAYGIISGYFPGTACRGGNSGAGVGIFGAIDAAQSTLGVTLLKNVNLAPTVSYTRSCGPVFTCTFYGNGIDEDGRVVSYTWNFGDGTTASGATVTHSWSLPGSKTVSVTVRDNNGAAGATSQTFTVL